MNTKNIDNMDISDKKKAQIHSDIKENKRSYLNNIKTLINQKISNNLHTYVEHTNHGLNLRIVPDNSQKVKEVNAICEYAGLTKIEQSKTNSNNDLVWLRYKI